MPRHERMSQIEKMLAMVELQKRRDDIVNTLSGGMRRRLEIARGLLHIPKILFLDEPTLGLDPQTRSHIWSYLHKLREEKDLTIFLTTHYMDEAENCDSIAIIDHGEIIALGTPEELKQKVGGDIIYLKADDNRTASEFVKRVYGHEIDN